MKKYLFLLLTIFSWAVNAQEGSLDREFETGEGFAGEVYDLLIQEDGRILAAGNFGSYDGFKAFGFSRINPGGSVDINITSVQGRNNSTFFSLGLQSDGKMLLGGNLLSLIGNSTQNLLRFTSDGTLDELDLGTGLNGAVRAIEVLSEDEILIGGEFTDVDRSRSPFLARLDSDGEIDTDFLVENGFDGPVYTIAEQEDGRILVGGNFKIYNESNQNRLLRLNPDGSLDETFNIGSGFDGLVSKVLIQNDGKIVVVGDFNSFQGIGQNRVVRLNPDGSLDPSFQINGEFDAIIHDAVIQNDGKIILGGAFRNFAGVALGRIARLLPDGSFDPSFQTGSGFDSDVRALALESGGKLIVAGSFKNYNGTFSRGIARLITESPLIVSNTNPAGNGSLNQAIQSANEQAGTQVIQFNLSTNDPGYMSGQDGVNYWRIFLNNSLPEITDPVIIDGRTQAGYDGGPLIELSRQANSVSEGLDIKADNCEIYGLAINNFSVGIQIEANQTRIEQNQIGALIGEGLEAAGNGTGIFINGSKNQIINNVIAYSEGSGIQIEEGSANTLRLNSIFCNADQGINLGESSNKGVGIPIITEADDMSIQGTCVVGALVEVYADNPACGGPSQGRTFLGNASVNRNVWILNGDVSLGDRITAIQTNESGNTSEFSKVVQISASATIAPPFNVNALSFSQDQIQVTWEDTSASLSSFEIEVFNESSNDFSFISLGANSRSFLFSGNAGTLYCFRVRNVSPVGNSVWSNQSCARPQPIPSAPTNLQANPDSLTWQDNSISETGFEIEAQSILSDNNFEILAKVDANVTSFSLKGLLNDNILYTFRVRAFNNFGRSAYSNLDSLVNINNSDIPSPPNNLDAQSVSPSQINLSWDYLLDNESIFVVERSLFSNNFEPQPDVSYQLVNNSENTIKRLTDTQSLQEDSLYCYRVRVISDGGVSTFSDTICTRAFCNLDGALVVLRNDGGVTGDVICDGRAASMAVIPEVQNARYQWLRNGEAIPGVEARLANYLASETGNYSCEVSLNASCEAITINEVLVIVQGTAPSLSIQFDGFRFQSSIPDAAIYQWFRDGIAIPGANDNNYLPSEPGAYFLVAEFGTGVGACASTSNVVIFPEVVAAESGDLSNAMQISPNPGDTQIRFKLESPLRGDYTWRILDLHGQVILEERGKKSAFDWENTILVENLPQGIYLLEILMDGKRGAQKIMIE